MELYADQLFHIYNRGNNRQVIFYSRDNYLLFLKKVREKLLPHLDILAYCLMPNHFHLQVLTKKDFNKAACANAFKSVLSSYTQAVNQRENRTGSLFTQNTKSKPLSSLLQSQMCFHYIHQNPLRANLVSVMEGWEFSSFRDYIGLRNGTLCDQRITRLLLDLPESGEDIRKESNKVIDPDIVKMLL